MGPRRVASFSGIRLPLLGYLNIRMTFLYSKKCYKCNFTLWHACGPRGPIMQFFIWNSRKSGQNIWELKFWRCLFCQKATNFNVYNNKFNYTNFIMWPKQFFGLILNTESNLLFYLLQMQRCGRTYALVTTPTIVFVLFEPRKFNPGVALTPSSVILLSNSDYVPQKIF